VYLLEKFGNRMSRCGDCGLAFTYPLPNEELIASRYCPNWFQAEYLPSYGIDYKEPSLSHLDPKFDFELAPLEKYRKLNRLLDVGAGAGILMAQARRLGWDVSGVELSEFGPGFAMRHFGLDIVQGTLERASFRDAEFDAVILQDTIEHLAEPFRILEIVRRLLRPGGVVVISTPNFDSLSRRAAGKNWKYISPCEHLVLFNSPSLRRILKRAGFQVDRMRTTPPYTAPSARIASSLLRSGFRSAKILGKSFLEVTALGDELWCWARAVPRSA
jgi:2-polyprenyl-3-methyl-5-hydroxy-6-metoxy-1,4-benzoquinol methylase